MEELWGEGEIAGIKVYTAAIEEGDCFGDLSMAESKILVLLRESAILTPSVGKRKQNL